MPRIDLKSPVADAAHRRVVGASWAVFALFALSGFTFASWAARLPAIRDGLSLTPAVIGLILLVGSLGSVLALPLTGAIVTRLGARRTVVTAVCVLVLGYLGAVAAFAFGSVPLLPVGLVVAGAGVATLDVAMNLEGALVEQRLGRAIMPIYHAGFSLGTVIGAGVGALMAAWHVPVQVHLPCVLAFVVLAALACVRRFLPPRPASTSPDGGASGRADLASQDRASRVLSSGEVSDGVGNVAGEVSDGVENVAGEGPRVGAFSGWLEPRTLLVGLVVLAAALTEGSANDWLSLASIDAFGMSNAGGAVMLALFLVAMTTMRFVGTGLLDRLGRVPMVRLSFVLALVGLVLFGFAPNALVGGFGVVAWGLGAALGFPVGMSAASDDPARAAARMSVVSTIGYTAFLAGPPLLGLLAEHIGYRHALVWIALPLLVGLALTGALAPLRGSAGARLDSAEAPAPDEAAAEGEAAAR